MVNVSEFKPKPNKKFIDVIDVVNAKSREAVINGEAEIKDFKALNGEIYKKLVIPVVFEGKEMKIGVYEAVSDRLGGILGYETKDWIGARLELRLEGSKGTKGPYVNVYVISGGIKS